MRFFLLFLALTSSALAEEAKAPEATAVSARSAYKATLQAQLDKSGIDEITTSCDTARTSYLDASAELARITTELAVPVDPVLGSLQTDYRASLEPLKKAEEARIAKAKADAKSAGAKLVAANAKAKAIEAEIKRIDGVERQETAIRSSQYNDLVEGAIADTGLGTRSKSYGKIEISGVLSENPKSSSTSIPLPAEFSSCFPKEVVPAS